MIEQDQGLKKAIGVWGLTANIINIMIGAGIFALPALVAGVMGASSIFSYIFCGILITLVVLCFAEAGSKVNSTGGPYTYIETAFGPYAGFVAGVFAVVSNILASAAVVNVLVDILASVHPVFAEPWMRVLFISLLYFALAIINIIGVKQGLGLVKLNTILKLTPLLLLAFIGWKDVSLGNLHIESLPTFSKLGESSLILFFAFLGCEVGLIVGGEIKKPKRTIPRAIFIAIGSVVLLYMVIHLVAQGVLGDQLPNFVATPLAETAKIVFGPFGFIMLLIGSAISMFGNVSGDMLNSPRILFALSRDHVIPLKKLSRIHPRFSTPYVAIAVYSFLVLSLALTGSFEGLVVLATSSVLLLYLGVALSVIRLRKTIPSEPGEFKIPGGLIVPVLSIVAILYFLSNLSKEDALGTLVFIAVLSLTYTLIEFFKRRKLNKHH